MIDLQNLSLPLDSSTTSFELKPDQVQGFRELFEFESQEVPPTVVCKSFEGLFEIFNRLEVDFTKLLHIAQKFEFGRPLKETEKLKSKTKLLKARERGETTWLSFESRLWDEDCESPVMTASATILISTKKIGESE